MKKTLKTLLIISIFIGNMPYSFADRGVRNRTKKTIALNINTSNSFKNSLYLNLKSGLKFKGLEFAETTNSNNFIHGLTIMTYEKGNTTYIIPNQRKIIVPEVKQGYTGMKLILKP